MVASKRKVKIKISVNKEARTLGINSAEMAKSVQNPYIKFTDELSTGSDVVTTSEKGNSSLLFETIC